MDSHKRAYFGHRRAAEAFGGPEYQRCATEAAKRTATANAETGSSISETIPENPHSEISCAAHRAIAEQHLKLSTE